MRDMSSKELRKLDARVAALAMGYTDVIQAPGSELTGGDNGAWWGDPPEPSEWGRKIPYYLSDASADYTVLCKVRSTWRGVARLWFNVELDALLHRHLYEDCQRAALDQEPLWEAGSYRVGDYSRAALAALVRTSGDDV